MIKKLLYIAREVARSIKSGLVYAILKCGMYKKRDLPCFDEQFLHSKWAYRDPRCVAFDFDNNHRNLDLSIIVPLYKSAKLLPRLKSMLENQQTKYSYEVILVNDGSPDNTAELIKGYEGESNRIVTINQDNGGISSARNAGIAKARGRYLAFLDHDDEISQDYIEQLVTAGIQEHAQIVKCEYAQKYGDTIIPAGVASGYIWGGIFSKELFENVRFPNGYWYEDMINNFIIFPQANKVATVRKILYFKNSTPNNASKVTWKASNYQCIEHVYLIRNLMDGYHELGIENKEYLFKRVLIECSTLAYERTKCLEDETKMQVFLYCCKLVEEVSNGCKMKVETRKDLVRLKALIDKDYVAWCLAAKMY